MDGREYPHIVFIHIPKTGGTTVAHYLESQYPDELVCPHHYLYEFNPENVNEFADRCLFRGHFSVDIFDLLPFTQEYARITILREPISRLLSLYNFYHAHRPEFIESDKGISGGVEIAIREGFKGFLESSAESILLEAHNRTAQQFLLEAERKQLIPGYPATHDEIVDIIIRRLEKFDLVGVLDHFNGFVNRLVTKFGFKQPGNLPRRMSFEILPANVERFRKIEKYSKPTEEELEVARGITRVDLDVYKHFACKALQS
jgi:hypothetical protein